MKKHLYSVLLITLFSIFFNANIHSVSFSPQKAYDLFLKDDKSTYYDKLPNDQELKGATKLYEKIFINTNGLSRNEIDKIFSSNKKIHLIITDDTFNRWNTNRLLARGKNRILIISNKWSSWDIRSLANQRAFIIIDGTRFDYWNLSKIMESGAYVIVDNDQLNATELKQLYSSPYLSRFIVYFSDSDNENIENFKSKNINMIVEGDETLTQINLVPLRKIPKKTIETTETKPQPNIDEMINEWMEAAKSKRDLQKPS
ncbi:MAG: hypothetical protein VX777_04455 [Chlamydiota bacterium]|nr:hypothetical protein [Chlamydiota bacterium]